MPLWSSLYTSPANILPRFMNKAVENCNSIETSTIKNWMENYFPSTSKPITDLQHSFLGNIKKEILTKDSKHVKILQQINHNLMVFVLVLLYEYDTHNSQELLFFLPTFFGFLWFFIFIYFYFKKYFSFLSGEWK